MKTDGDARQVIACMNLENKIVIAIPAIYAIYGIVGIQ